uniref:P-type domain-containing protein n=1 Tax=Varanus komodoensis TaxID=61221 RepID=A0A8D2LI81_VARKO
VEATKSSVKHLRPSSSQKTPFCNVPGRLRQNCGFPGITELECSALQCCFDSNQIGVPWCYQPIQEDGYEC